MASNGVPSQTHDVSSAGSKTSRHTSADSGNQGETNNLYQNIPSHGESGVYQNLPRLPPSNLPMSVTYDPPYINVGSITTTRVHASQAHPSTPDSAPASLSSSQQHNGTGDSSFRNSRKFRAGTTPSGSVKWKGPRGGEGEWEGQTGECENCAHLTQLVSMWELGVSGLARNCSRILAQLNKASDAAGYLETKMKENTILEQQTSGSSANGGSGSLLGKGNRYSMLETNSLRTVDAAVAVQMYPDTLQMEKPLPATYAKFLNDLKGSLQTATDLCQKLAVACFKSNQTTDSRLQNPGVMLRHVITPPAPIFQPTLTSISEQTRRHGSLQRSQSSDLEHSSNFLVPNEPLPPPRPPTPDMTDMVSLQSDSGARSPTHQHSEAAPEHSNGTPSSSRPQKINSPLCVDSDTSFSPEGSDSTDSGAADGQKPFHSHMMSLLAADQMRAVDGFSVAFPDASCGKGEGEGGSKGEGEEREGVLFDRSESFSDDDVKNVMSKIASLEDDRFKLLETIEKLRVDNQTVRLSLCEMLGDLENKDLQLSLAMQDLTIATSEIRRAAEMRAKLDSLENERSFLTDKLSNLEDESAAVKVSLIHLLQEKSATNKTLALENSRLNQKVRQMGSTPSGTLRKSSSGSRPGMGLEEGDSISVASNVTTGEIDTAMQEVYYNAGMEDARCIVHKQGFLTKQGGKVKNWKRRLFVLDSEGLSYFKTESPLHSIPLSRISKVKICHGEKLTYPYLFEVHTPERTFLLSAPSDDEMQSWVGMLQTLHHHTKTRQPGRAVTLKTHLQRAAVEEDPGLPQRRLHSEAAALRSRGQVVSKTGSEIESELSKADGSTHQALQAKEEEEEEEEEVTVGCLKAFHPK